MQMCCVTMLRDMVVVGLLVLVGFGCVLLCLGVIGWGWRFGVGVGCCGVFGWGWRLGLVLVVVSA